MFEQMRSALGITKNIDILDHCYSLAPLEQQNAFKKICDIESEAMKTQVPQPGLLKLMEYLEERNIPKAICTRNFDAPVTHLLQTFIPYIKFAPIVTRSFQPPKPSPAGILHIARSWGLKKKNELNEESEDTGSMIMVGTYEHTVSDSIDDLTAGYRAGTATVLISNETNAHLATHEYCDLVIETLDKLIEVLENGFTARIKKEDKFGNLD
ncbi:putative hydrolase [Erysiphe neolycopersici]|uniref:Putative hydrolase n=1 Tax=Erysiphe neolycopersici TaxID=212602 RepID=A0A420HIZ0_9PEZI|nr:putative hydrolase [Erysiphe neolycopersici]